MQHTVKLQQAYARYQQLETLLGDQAIIADQDNYQKLAKEYSDLTPVVAAYQQYQSLEKQAADLTELLAHKQDADFTELAQLESADLVAKMAVLQTQIDEFLNPPREGTNRNLIFEIRAGTGGQEASLFAADLYRMYVKYAEKKGWKVEAISNSDSETGGFKEVVFSISGKGAADRLKWESGAHRVQRVPATEASGRIHTSAATVAVLFEAEDVEVEIDQKDVRIDIFRSSGPGGQSVNTTDSAVRLTHLPTGIVVSCQDERSQLKNRHKAFRVLRARLFDQRQQEARMKECADRRLKVGTGDRSEKIRTYNFPDRRVTDHRIGFTTHQLMSVLDGELDELTDALIAADIADSVVG